MCTRIVVDNASARTASTCRTSRVLSTEGESLRAEAEARHAVAHVLLERIEEAHFQDFVRSLTCPCHADRFSNDKYHFDRYSRSAIHLFNSLRFFQ